MEGKSAGPLRRRSAFGRYGPGGGEVAGEEVLFPGVVPRLERRPGRVRWLGPDLGSDTDAILTEAG